MTDIAGNPNVAGLRTPEVPAENRFELLVIVCADRLNRAAWTSVQDGGLPHERQRATSMTLASRTYRLHQYGVLDGEDVQPYPYCMVSVDGVHRGDGGRLGAFIVDPQTGVELAGATDDMLAVFGTDESERIEHLLSVLGLAGETLDDLRLRASDAARELLDKLGALGWLTRRHNRIDATALEAYDNRNDIWGLRLSPGHVRIEHHYMRGDGAVHEDIEFEHTDSRSFARIAVRVGSAPQSTVDERRATEAIGELLEYLLQVIEQRELVPFTPGPRPTGGFRMVDIQQHVQQRTKQA